MVKREISKIEEQLRLEIRDLQIRLDEAEETLHANQNGEVDSIVVQSSHGDKMFSLESSETHYRLFIEEMSEGAATLTTEGIILYSNNHFSNLLSLHPSKITGTNFCQIFPDQEKQKLNELLNLGKEERCFGEIEFINPEGKINYLNISLFPLNSGDTIDICVIAKDITERKQVEYKLLDEQAFRNSIESSLSSGIAIVDDEGRQTYVNPSFCKLFGWSAEELIGKTAPFVYWPTDQLPAIGEAFQLTVAGNAPQEGFELEFVHKNGLRIPAQVIITPFYDGKKRTGWLANVIDITKRKKAEDALKESRRRLLEAHKLAHIGVWDWDAEADSVVWSDELYKISGRDPKLPAPTFAEHSTFYTPKSRQNLKTAVESSMKTGESYELDLDQVRFDGSIRNVKAFGGAKYDDLGRFTGLFGTLQDITELKQSEENIKKLNRIYALLSNINQSIVHIHDRQLLFDEACNIAVDHGGFLMAWIGIVNTITNKVEVVASSGKAVEYLNDINIDLNDELRSSGPTGQAVKSGKSDFSNNIETDDKMIPWRKNALKFGFRSSITLPIFVSGKILGTYTMYSGETDFFSDDEIKLLDKLSFNISFALEFIESESDRKQVEESILNLNWRLESIIEGTQVGTWEWNVQTGEAVFNELWADIIGYTIDQLAPISIKTWEAYAHPDDLKQSEKLLERHFAGELPNYDCECRIKHKDGHWVWVHDRGRVITRTNDGKPLMMFGTHSAITERKKAELEILSKNEELQKLNATKDKFFSIIAHDLRSPFNSIVGFSELLLDQISKKNYDEVENYAQIIKKSSGHAIKLLMNLMEWSRLQTGRMEFNPEYFELVNLISEIAYVSLENSRQKEMIVKKILPQSATVYADKNMISTVLRNLFSNAIKFSHPGGTITISVSVQQNELTISLSDTGIGIAKTRVNKLFLINESYSTLGTQKEKGTGLGLILCKEFVDKNGGKIWTESLIGKGSTFYFTLPRHEKSNEEDVVQYEIPTSAPASENWMNKLKILIVEDDETSEKLLAVQVKNFGKEVMRAVTGVEAVDICRKNPDIDLILMDIQLPEMDGYEATRQIREFNKDVIIIALTAYGFDKDSEKAILAGCNDYKVKPVSKDQLRNMIEKIFKG